MPRGLFVLTLFAVQAAAMAGKCTFQTSGDPRNGLAFKAQTQVPGLSISSALGQLQHLALEGGYALGNERITATSGQLSFLQTRNQPALVVWAQADATGRVSLSLTLAPGQKVEPAAVESELCALLGKVNAGKEGEALAAAARAKSGLGRTLPVEAVTLSKTLDKEVKQALAPANRDGVLRLFSGKDKEAGPREVEALFAPIRARYLGQKYRIEGQVWASTRNVLPHHVDQLVNPHLELVFDVRKRKGLLGVREDSTEQDLHFQIVCRLTKDQFQFFQSLTEGDFATLTGTVVEIEPGRMVIGDARKAP